ncbi:MAG: rhomboid family intramembrane serine protease [archaeon]|nr:rhomboid family intramembrane serine protease [Candidatus Micrarchaeota archaeon]
MKEKILPALKKLINFKATIFLALIIYLSFIYLSEGKPFIPSETIIALSFSFYSLGNFLFYMLIHSSIFHLTVNLVSLIAFALIVENKLKWKDCIALFFFAGILTAISYGLIHTDTILIGASAGVSGLIVGAFLLDPKKTFIAAILIVVLLSFVFIPSAQTTLISYSEKIEQKSTKIAEDINKAIEKGDTNKAVDLNRQFTEVKKEIKEFKKAEELRLEVEVDPWIHGYGAVFGIIYLFAFRRKKLQKEMKSYLPSGKK